MAAMYEAAEIAGMISSAYYPNASPHMLITVLEPEAASLACLLDPAFSEYLDHGDPYIVADLGGGTTDIVVHAHGLLQNAKAGHLLREVVPGSGGLCGGSHVDDEFIQFAIKSYPGLQTAAVTHPKEYLKMLVNYNKAKCTFNGVDPKIIDVPQKLMKRIKPPKNDDDDNDDDDEEEGISATAGEMCAFFDPTIHTIIKLIDAQMEAIRAEIQKPAKVIALVGGFSESPYVAKRLREKFGPHFNHILIPPKAGNAVVKGAVIYGLNPSSLYERCSRRTYAIETGHDAEPGDKRQHQYTSKGKVKTSKLSYFVKAGQRVGFDQVVTKTSIRLEPMPVRSL